MNQQSTTTSGSGSTSGMGTGTGSGMGTSGATSMGTGASGMGAGSSASGIGSGSGTGIGDEIRQLVREKTYEQIGTQKERATGTLGAVAGAVRSATDGLRDTQPALANYVTRAADEIDRWTSRLREQDLDDAMREVQDFARRKPALFLGVAFGAGVIVARFLKSSGPGSSSMSSGRSSQAPWRPPSASYVERPSIAHDAPDLGAGFSSTGEVL